MDDTDNNVDSSIRLATVTKIDLSQPSNVNEIIEWIRGHEEKGNAFRMIVMMEGEDEVIRTKAINLLKRDYSHWLLKELVELFGDKNE